MSEVNTAQLERQLDAARKAKSDLAQLERLLQNKDFKAIFGQEFFVIEAARYAQLSADPSIPTENQRDALNIAQATGHVKRWLAIKELMLRNQIGDIESLESDLDALRAEEAGE